MDRQLQVIADDLHEADRRLRRLDVVTPRVAWESRPGLGRWSAAECIAHLNLTSEALLPLVHDGLQEVRGGRPRGFAPYQRDLLGWLIWAIMSPSRGFKTKTIPAFVPTRPGSCDHLIAEFHRLQDELQSCVAAADGLPIDRVKITSPFDSRVRYNLYAVLTLVPRHQHRHLAQAKHAAGVHQLAESALAV